MFGLSENEESNINRNAIALTHFAFRNGPIEDIHAGTAVLSKTGDFSDVKVVTPYGEIPWNNLSRITDEEMKKLNKFMVNRLAVYHKLIAAGEFEKLGIIMQFDYLCGSDWDEPEIDGDLKALLQHVEAGEPPKKDEK